MRKKVLFAGIIAIVVGIAAGAFAVQYIKAPSAVQSSTTSSQATVSIGLFRFSPGNLKVARGATVTWTNNDIVSHTVSETDGKAGPNSKDLDHGATYSFTFSQSGTFHYRCNIHTDMLGTIVVAD
jgi:plastocyanin